MEKKAPPKRRTRRKRTAAIVPQIVEATDTDGEVVKEATGEKGLLPQQTPGYVQRKQQREFERILKMNKGEDFHPYIEAILFIRDQSNSASLRLQMILKTMELQSSPMPAEGSTVDVDAASGSNGQRTRIGLLIEH